MKFKHSATERLVELLNSQEAGEAHKVFIKTLASEIWIYKILLDAMEEENETLRKKLEESQALLREEFEDAGLQ